MTSQSLKKRPTTARNTRAATPLSRRAPLIGPCCTFLFIFLFTVVISLAHPAAGDDARGGRKPGRAEAAPRASAAVWRTSSDGRGNWDHVATFQRARQVQRIEDLASFQKNGPAADPKSEVPDAINDPFGDGSGDGGPSDRRGDAGNAPPSQTDAPSYAPGLPSYQPIDDEPLPSLDPLLLPPSDESYYDQEPPAANYEQECETSRDYLLNRRLSDISLDIDASGDAGIHYPNSCRVNTDEMPLAKYRAGEQAPMNFAWTASGLYHKPLYYEELRAERHGQTAGCFSQPILSAAHFFVSTPLLPYKMGLKPPNECVYALGHYRPGSCAPQYIPAVPISLRAGLMQAGAVLGGVYILP